MSLTEFTPRQECIVGSVNMAPKAILHFVCDPDMAYTAGELDELFIKAQGEVPIWAPARSYAANTLGKLPVKNKTFNVDHTRPRTFQLSPEDGVGIARPAALHLTQLALSEGVDIPDLVGESLGSTNNRKSSQAIRYHGIQLLRSLKKADTFTITSLTTELGISPTAATYLIEVLVTPGYLAQDPKCQGTRNVYARYFIPSPNSELIIPDVTFGTRFSDALRHLSDENSPFDAADVAKKMGYNPKYNGDKIAEILKTVNAMGTIQKVDDEAYRDIPYRTTDHGRFVFEVLNWIYNNINDPSKRFLGQALEFLETMTPEKIKQLLRNGGYSNDTIQRSPLHSSMSTAFDMLKRAERPLSTNEMRTMLGKSKTATHRLLNEALACGLLTKNKIGKTIYWEIAS